MVITIKLNSTKEEETDELNVIKKIINYYFIVHQEQLIS
jgi:hypothetical protein